MNINFTPIRGDDVWEVSRSGDNLIINGEVLDTSGVLEGATLPRAAVDCAWLASDIERIGGVVSLTLVRPYGIGATEDERVPASIVLDDSGRSVPEGAGRIIIDLSKLITAEDKVIEAATKRADDIKMRVRARIFSVIDQSAQTSLLAAGLAEALSAQEKATFVAGQQWIEATKVEGRRAAMAGDEPNWPDVPEGVAELAERY
ncbi:hypothetical protein QEZ52_00235 [Aliisedimentitalea scapharcae]|uniref:Tail fiber assembly protein n=1 Tax=Aliisedimentitalea scapharcae TaxID=1524259 RepID=A0ABZ2XSD7_9RHOB